MALESSTQHGNGKYLIITSKDLYNYIQLLQQLTGLCTIYRKMLNITAFHYGVNQVHCTLPVLQKLINSSLKNYPVMLVHLFYKMICQQNFGFDLFHTSECINSLSLLESLKHFSQI